MFARREGIKGSWVGIKQCLLYLATLGFTDEECDVQRE